MQVPYTGGVVSTVPSLSFPSERTMGKQRANRRPRETRPHVDADRKTPPTTAHNPALRAGDKDALVATSTEIKARAQAAWERGDEEEALKLEQEYRDQLLLEASECEESSDEAHRRSLLIQAKERGWLSGGVGIEDDMQPFFDAAQKRRMAFPS